MGRNSVIDEANFGIFKHLSWSNVCEWHSRGRRFDPEPEYGGWAALMIAASNGHTDVVSVLLESGADINAKSHYGWTALKIAADKGYTDTVRVLLEAGADYDSAGLSQTLKEVTERNGEAYSDACGYECLYGR